MVVTRSGSFPPILAAISLAARCAVSRSSESNAICSSRSMPVAFTISCQPVREQPSRRSRCCTLFQLYISSSRQVMR